MKLFLTPISNGVSEPPLLLEAVWWLREVRLSRASIDSRRPRRDGRVPIPPWSSKSLVLDNSSGLAEAMLGSSAIVGGTVPSGELWGHPGPQPVGNSSGLLWGAIRPLRALAGPALHRDGHGFSHRGKRVDHHPGPARRPSAVLHRGHSLLAVGDEKRTRRLAAAAQRTLPTHSGMIPWAEPSCPAYGPERRALECRSS